MAESKDLSEAMTAEAFRCDATPKEVFCLSYIDNKRNERWGCYTNLNRCREAIENYKEYDTIVKIRCERMAFAQALPKLR